MTGENSTKEYFFRSEMPDARRRVAVMEMMYDNTSISRLRRVDIQQGWRCLEAGAGGGSIARWLAGQVGPKGTVHAIDLDVSLLAGQESDVVTVTQADLRHDTLPSAEFDLVHTRLVLGHIAEREEVLDRLISAVRPGGYLVLEEGDWFASAALEPELHNEVMTSALRSAEANGFAARWGRGLPGLCRARGLTGITVDCDVPIHEGGSPELEWLRITFDLLNSSTSPLPIAPYRYNAWRQMISTPGRWFTGMATMSVTARTPQA